MTIGEVVTALKPLLDSKLVAATAPALLSAPIGALFALWTYRNQSKELIDGAIAWLWINSSNHADAEEPFLVLQNRSAVPAFLIRARYLRGIFIRREATRYAFNYDDPTDGNFPLEVKAQNVTHFPLYAGAADKIVAKANIFSRSCGYLLKRPYLWIEVTTLSGRKLTIAANDVTSWNDRPLWLQQRWVREPKPDWMKEAGL